MSYHINMNPGMDQKDWHYLIGMEVHGPVSLNEISSLVAAGTIAPDVMIASRESPRLRSAAEVLKEARGEVTKPPPLPAQRSLFDRIGESLNSVADTEKLEGFSLQEMFSE